MQRVCFTLQIRPERLAEYRRRRTAPDAAMAPLPEIFCLAAPPGAASNAP